MDYSDVSRKALVTHLRSHALRTDGPFTLASGAVSEWYLDGRQTTFDGEGGRRIAAAILAVLDPSVTAIGGMTMGADPIAVATAVCAPRALKAFSIRKEAKHHGTKGRLVGPIGTGDRVCVVEDTMTTGGSTADAIAVLRDSDIEVVQVVTVVDRSGGAAAAAMHELGLELTALVTPEDLGVAG